MLVLCCTSGALGRTLQGATGASQSAQAKTVQEVYDMQVPHLPSQPSMDQPADFRILLSQLDHSTVELSEDSVLAHKPGGAIVRGQRYLLHA